MPSVVCPVCGGRLETPKYSRKEAMEKLAEIHKDSCPGRHRQEPRKKP